MVHIQMSRSYIKVHGHRMQLFFSEGDVRYDVTYFGYSFSAEVVGVTSVESFLVS